MFHLQVAVKACQQLPQSLQHCMLEALVGAAQLQRTSSRASTQQGKHSSRKDQSQRDTLQRPSAAAVSPAIAAACLERVMAHVQLSSSSLAELVGLYLLSKLGHDNALLHSTLCLVLIALCSRCPDALPDDVAATIAAASLSCSQHLEQQALRSRNAAHDVAGIAAGRQSSKQAQCSNNSSIPGDGDSVEGDLQLAWLQLQVCATQQVLAAGEPRQMQMSVIATMSALLPMCACSMQMHQHVVHASVAQFNTVHGPLGSCSPCKFRGH